MALAINTSRISPNRSVRRSKVRRIVIHHWDDPQRKPSLAGVVSWLTSTRSKVSAHYVVSERQVYRLVPESVVAWHAAGGNSDSIGIELDPRQQDSTYETAAALIRDIRSRYGDIPLVRHRDVKGSYTSCPGTYDLARLDRLARGQSAKPASKPTPKPARLVVDGLVGPATVRRLQEWAGASVDGKAGHGTWRAVQRRVGTPVDGVVSSQYRTARQVSPLGAITQGWEHVGRGAKGSTMVRALQRKIGAKADGIWGPDTSRRLQEYLNREAG